MLRAVPSIFAAALLLMFIAACGGDPAAPTDTPPVDTGLDVEAVLADYVAGDLSRYASSLHDEFRFQPGDVGTAPYDRSQEVDLLQAMHDGNEGASGEILRGVELVHIEPGSDWIATDRDDRLGAHRPGARKRTYRITLRFLLADPDDTRTVDGLVTAFADTAAGTLCLLGLVDGTGDPTRGDAPSWTEVRHIWADPETPDRPGTPDLLSMRWIAAHDGRDWLRMGELLHPEFRYVDPDGEMTDRAEELALFADLMAGRPNRNDARVTRLDAQNWEHMEGPWTVVGADDPHFGDVPDAVAQWLSIRIVYTTEGGEDWVVDGLVRMAAVQTLQGYQMLGFVDDSVGTGEPGSLGWTTVRARFR